MSCLPAVRPARLFTTFGTVLYVDSVSGELRHGAIESSPANAVLAPHAPPVLLRPSGYLMYEWEGLRKPIAMSAGSFCVFKSVEGNDSSNVAAELEIIPLERGLMGLKFEGLFLTAQPDGRIDGSRPWCSTWESFLASEDWCAANSANADERVESAIDKKRIARFIVDPRLRAKVNAKSSATKVLIYGYPQWSHGRVYYDLCKQLQRKGYIVDLLNWRISHTDYINELAAFYDFFMTSPDGVRILVDVYRVPYEKIIAISHHEMDIRMLIEQNGVDAFDKFAGYGVVSTSVYCASMMLGVRRPPMVTSLGVNFAEFYSDPSERLQTVGYASSMSVTTYGVEWKRGYLAEVATREAGLAFQVAGSTANQTSFHDMPDFYRTVDAVLSTSVSEGAGLQVIEAAAAGRLVIGTPVGHFPLKAYQGGGIIAPIEATKFITFGAATLRYYKENPAEYVAKCRSIQEAARQFDWKYSIREWIELIEGARRSEWCCRDSSR